MKGSNQIMKSKLTGKQAQKKTIEESVNEFIALNAEAEFESEKNNKIIKSGKKKIVSNQIYSEHFDPSDCRYCMNYDMENDSCRENMPNIDPWYTKDNDLPDDCEKWDYIYETKE